MNHTPNPDTTTATFLDGPFTVRLSIPVEEAPSWRQASPDAILGHLGLAVMTAPIAEQPNGTDAARAEPTPPG